MQAAFEAHLKLREAPAWQPGIRPAAGGSCGSRGRTERHRRCWHAAAPRRSSRQLRQWLLQRQLHRSWPPVRRRRRQLQPLSWQAAAPQRRRDVEAGPAAGSLAALGGAAAGGAGRSLRLGSSMAGGSHRGCQGLCGAAAAGGYGQAAAQPWQQQLAAAAAAAAATSARGGEREEASGTAAPQPEQAATAAAKRRAVKIGPRRERQLAAEALAAKPPEAP